MSSDKIKSREQVRADLRKQREKELKKERTRRGFIIGGIGTASILAIGGATWGIIASRPEPVILGEQISPAKVDEFGAFHIGSDGQVLDDKTPTGATRMDMFIDPQCPACGVVDRAIGERVNELLANNEIDLFLTPTAFMNDSSTDDYSSRAVNALITVAEESPEHYLDFMNKLFEEDVQPGGGMSYIPVSDSQIGEYAMSVGVSEEVAKKFEKGHYIDWIEQHTNTQLNDRPDLFPESFSTPSVFFNIQYENGESSGHTKVEFGSDPLESFNSTFEAVNQN